MSSTEPTHPDRRALARTVLAAIVAGAVRAVLDWLLDR